MLTILGLQVTEFPGILYLTIQHQLVLINEVSSDNGFIASAELNSPSFYYLDLIARYFSLRSVAIE